MIVRPCDPDATPEVRRVMEFFNSIEGKAFLAGQHTQTMGMEETTYIYRETGKWPALCGFELLSYSPNINWGHLDEPCLTEILGAAGTLRRAYEWAGRKGLLTFTWHWFSPVGGENKSFFSRYTDFDANQALREGTLEHCAMCHDLDIMAQILDGFQARHIPILWRPFHEAEGDWFWWGAKGAQTARKLYRFMFRYFTEKHQLHNLIWVWNSPLREGYVGDDCCDIISRDMYPPAHAHGDYRDKWQELAGITDAAKGAVIAETGVLPDPDAVERSHTPWLWYMTWSHDFCCSEQFTTKEMLRRVYHHPCVLTLDKLPALY